MQSVRASQVMYDIRWEIVFTNVIKQGGEDLMEKKSVVVRGNTGMCLDLRQHSFDLCSADGSCSYSLSSILYNDHTLLLLPTQAISHIAGYTERFLAKTSFPKLHPSSCHCLRDSDD